MTAAPRSQTPASEGAKPPISDVVRVDVMRYERLVRSIAVQLRKGKPPQVKLQDMVAYGWVGLLEAAKRFDPSRGLQFTTYAYPRIRGAILDGISLMHKGSSKTRFLEDLSPYNRGDASEAARLRSSADAYEHWRDQQERVDLALSCEQLRPHLCESDTQLWDVITSSSTRREAGARMGVSKSWASRRRSELVQRARRIAA